jgi:hypothetical protein
MPEKGVGAHLLGVESLKEGTALTNDDLIFRHRVRLFARASEIGVTEACRELGYHRPWY